MLRISPQAGNVTLQVGTEEVFLSSYSLTSSGKHAERVMVNGKPVYVSRELMHKALSNPTCNVQEMFLHPDKAIREVRISRLISRIQDFFPPLPCPFSRESLREAARQLLVYGVFYKQTEGGMYLFALSSHQDKLLGYKIVGLVRNECYGSLFRATSLSTGKTCAIKIGDTKKEQEEMTKETKLGQQLFPELRFKLLGVAKDGKTFMRQTLYAQHLQNLPAPSSLAELFDECRGLIALVKKVHDQGYVHRNLSNRSLRCELSDHSHFALGELALLEDLSDPDWINHSYRFLSQEGSAEREKTMALAREASICREMIPHGKKGVFKRPLAKILHELDLDIQHLESQGRVSYASDLERIYAGVDLWYKLGIQGIDFAGAFAHRLAVCNRFAKAIDIAQLGDLLEERLSLYQNRNEAPLNQAFLLEDEWQQEPVVSQSMETLPEERAVFAPSASVEIESASVSYSEEEKLEQLSSLIAVMQNKNHPEHPTIHDVEARFEEIVS